jgi:hypothetical protein|uniref:Uncharacterized protein n=1 Tax=viral metagenome TaxID=1070528 RepID=A0A6C0BRG0_9ZZZZ
MVFTASFYDNLIQEKNLRRWKTINQKKIQTQKTLNKTQHESDN